MAESMMIFKSHTVSNRIVLALDLKDNQGVDIIVPLELEAVKGREKTHIITSIYGRGYGSGRTRSTDHVWYINNVMGGSTLYVNKRKAKTFYQSAGLQLPLEGKRFFDLFGSSIKTEEDLVKFKLQKEEEYKAAAAREAANEKDSSLQTQPAEQQSPPSSPIQNRINYFEKNFTVTLDKEPFFYACCNFHGYCV